jgi:hypothetical protein
MSISDPLAQDPGNYGQPFFKGSIIDPEVDAIYRLFQQQFPAFFFPVHMFRSDKYGHDIDWEGLLEKANRGQNIVAELQAISKIYPENITAAANLYRLRITEETTNAIPGTPEFKEVCRLCCEQVRATPVLAMVVGNRHGCPIMKYTARMIGEALGIPLFNYIFDQGFVNQWGYYRNRKEAYAVVKFHGNVLRGSLPMEGYDELYSEHLH